MRFEVLVSDQFVVLKNGVSSIWWNRFQPTPTNTPVHNVAPDTTETFDVKVVPKPEFRILKDDLESTFDSFTCHGLAYGFVGQFQDDKLILIKQYQSIGRLPFGFRDEVFKIQKICVVSLATRSESFEYLGLDKCSQDTCTKPVIIMPSPSEPIISASFKDSTIDESSLSIQSFQSQPPSAAASGVQKTWNQIKLTASNVKPRVSNKFQMMSSGSGGQQQDDKEKFDRRFIDELYKMFNDTNSFYYSWTGDLTHSVQRQQKQKQYYEKGNNLSSEKQDIRLIALWKRVDDRFFWNKFMLKSLIETLEASTPTNETQKKDEIDLKTFSHIWILPIIQGFVQIEKCFFDLNESSPVGSHQKDFASGIDGSLLESDKSANDSPKTLGSFLEGRDYYLMTLISRRSRFRAGTRYKKRGLDDDGQCANYVETEQIFTYGSHTVSFVCVRGSVPLFWSQFGHKYRPPPLLERTDTENQQAFKKHFQQEFEIYENDTVAVNLIEHTGREKVLNDAFMEHVLDFDDPRLTYVSFDFHDYCRGMRFENVSILIDRIYEFIKEKRYCWIDSDGLICEQRGVFRINCIDCLDRTNIVMTAIAKAVMDIQLVRLGLLPPEGQLPANSRRIFQLMWAHNGDIISRQYAGTVALKGDYTRTGERKISGVVRDGYNSANRYYVNRFKDAYRQAIIDIMQGNPVSDILASPEHEKVSSKANLSTPTLSTSATSTSLSSNDQEFHERIKFVIEDCKKILVPEEEVILGGWPLVDADPVTGTALPTTTRSSGAELPESEMDIVLILTKDSYYVADYDDQTDRIVKYQKVLLEDLEKIELGAEPNYQTSPFGPIRNQNNRMISYAVRFHYTIDDQTGYFHMFRSTGTRFFNNMAIPIRTREEALESLKAICESFKVALSVKSLNVPFLEVGRLERRKSKRLYSSFFKLGSGTSNSHNSETTSQNGRMVGDSVQSGSAPSSRKLFTGVYSHLSRLRGKLTGSVTNSVSAPNRPSLQIDGIKLNQGPTYDQLPEECEQSSQNIEDVDDEESDEDDSLLKLRKKRYNRQLQYTNSNSSSSSLVVERSSDLSECSDIEDSELMLPPICEIGSPSGYEEELSMCHKENMDRVLESCGILVTSPPLRQTPVPSSNESDASYNTFDAGTSTPPPIKSVLHDVDDFVLDSMKKASLRQIHRKAVSQVSLFSSSTSILNNENPRINIENPGSIDGSSIPPRSSSRCIFSSELALNSIVSQSIKKDIVNKLSGSVSTNALDVSAGGVSSSSIDLSNQDEPNLAYQCGAYPLMSSSSFAALSYHDEADMTPFGSQTLSLGILPENCGLGGDYSLNRADIDNATLLNAASKEASLSVSDLAFGGAHHSLKTSRSSIALQSSMSGNMSLNLPSVNSSSVLTIAENDGISSNTSSSSNFTSSLMGKKDFVLSPLSRIAKGMQSLGINLRNSTGASANDSFSSGGHNNNNSNTSGQNSELFKRKQQSRCNIIEI